MALQRLPRTLYVLLMSIHPKVSRMMSTAGIVKNNPHREHDSAFHGRSQVADHIGNSSQTLRAGAAAR
jgi:hypothetical protein